MPNSKTFCNTPWYELQIYWDGSLGICCQEDHKLYTDNKYNIATMTIAEWFNSDPVQKFRKQMLGNQQVSACRRCYAVERQGMPSRRHRSNQKSVIFQQAFDESFLQSPGKKHFNETGLTETHPIDIHIDLGNYCNLACKMCEARASSVIAAQEVKWGIESSRQYVGTDWTRNEVVWQSFKQQLLDIPGLNNIHFMGGETLISDRFEDFVDTMIKHQRFELCFSFVTNGTVFRPELMNKLARFRRVGVEVSIETTDERNSYVRQGTDTELVLANIEKYQAWCDNKNITVTLRPAISALTIGYFPSLLEYALDKKFVIKSLLVDTPGFLDPLALPSEVKLQYLKNYQDIQHKIGAVESIDDFNHSDPNNYAVIIKQQIEMCVNILKTRPSINTEFLYQKLAEHCRQWDSVYGYNARELYPELNSIWDCYGY